MDTVTPQQLKQLLLGDDELALIDVREQGTFSESHLLFAICIPLSRLELLVGDLVPQASTNIVIVASAADDLAERACTRLTELGYRQTSTLAGGVEAWADAGYELFSGVNVPSKAFGEFVEHTYETPRLSAAEVKAMLDAGRDMVIVDSRPFTEYHRMNIPTATDMPGAELAYRIHDMAPDPDTFVVVNCAGRTRSIIGTQSLINAGIPNPVAALKDGTMGWHLAGYDLEHGSTREAAAPSSAGAAKARTAADRVGRRFRVPTVQADEVGQWLADSARTTFLLDVRSPAEYQSGHMAGYRNAPGGQLVQATDEYVGVKNARLVLADDIGVRATMTASWLIQMGWRDVHVLEGGISGETVTGPPQPRVLGEVAPAEVTPATLADQLGAITVIDLGPSTLYESGHIPDSLWCVRSRLGQALDSLPTDADVVLTSPDGLLARVALPQARQLAGSRRVDALAGGTDAWLGEGGASSTGMDAAIGPTDDVWYKPYEHRGAQEKFMREYLTWEVALVEQIERDGTSRFEAFAEDAGS